MNLYIPELGTVLVLAKDWTFHVENEKRNAGLAVVMGRKADKDSYYWPFGSTDNPFIEGRWGGRQQVPVDPGPYTFPKGTELVVDRIYIRKGNEEFSSVTFVTRHGGKQLRFFAKLDDVNRMEI